MEDLINEIIKMVAPLLASAFVAAIGAVLTKLVGILRAWQLGKRIKGAADTVRAELDRLHLKGLLDERLHGVLTGVLDNFAHNAAQVSIQAIEGLLAFALELQNRPQPAK